MRKSRITKYHHFTANIDECTLPSRHSVPLEPERYERRRHENDAGDEDGREIKMSVSRESKINSQAWIIAFDFFFVFTIVTKKRKSTQKNGRRMAKMYQAMEKHFVSM